MFKGCVIYIYIYAFSRHFYPKRLTIAFRLYIFISMCVPWESNPQPFALLTQCSTTEPHRNTASIFCVFLLPMLILLCDTTFRSIYFEDALPNICTDDWWRRRRPIFIYWGEQRCQFTEDRGVGGRMAGQGCQGLAFRWQKSDLWRSSRTVSRVHFQAW